MSEPLVNDSALVACDRIKWAVVKLGLLGVVVKRFKSGEDKPIVEVESWHVEESEGERDGYYYMDFEQVLVIWKSDDFKQQG